LRNTENINKTNIELDSKSHKVNNNLSLINKVYSSEKFESSNTKPASILENKVTAKSRNINEYDIIKDLTNDISITKSINNEEIEANLSILLTDTSKKSNILDERLGNIIYKRSTAQNKSNNESEFIKTINMPQQDDFIMNNVHLNHIEKKNHILNKNYQIEESTKDITLKLDDPNKNEKSNTYSLIMQDVEIGVDNRTKYLDVDTITKKNEIKPVNNTNEFEEENITMKQELLKNHVYDINERANKICIQSTKTNFVALKSKNSIIDKQESVNLFSKFEENYGDFKLLNDSNYFQMPVVENLRIDQKLNMKKIIKPENSVVISSNNEQNFVAHDKLDEINKLKLINASLPIDTNNDILKCENIDEDFENTQVKTANKDMSECTVENKNVEIFQIMNFDQKTKFCAKNEGKKSRSFQDIDISVASLQDTDAIKNSEHLKNINVNVSIDISQEHERTVTDLIKNIKIVNDIESYQTIKILNNSELVVDSSYLQEPKINNIETSLENIENVENLQNIKKQELQIETDMSKIAIKNIENKELISTTEMQFLNNKNIDEKICKINENNKKIQCEDDFFTNFEPQKGESLNKHAYKKIIKDLVDLEKIDDQTVLVSENNKIRQLDNESQMKHNLITKNEELTKNITLIREKTSNDLNKRSELEKSAILNKNKSDEIYKQKMLEAKNDIETSVKIDIYEHVVQNEIKKVIKNEIAKQTENIISLERKENNLVVSKNIKLNPLNKLIVNENFNNAKESAILESEKLNSNEITDIKNKGFNTNIKQLLEIEDKETENFNFINMSNTNVSIESIQSQDNFTKKKKKIEFESLEKNENIGLIFDECSQSFNQRQIKNDKFNDLYNSCTEGDSTESNDVLYNKKFNEQNNENNVKAEEKLNKIYANSGPSVNINHKRLEVLKEESMVFIKNKTDLEKSLEILELESIYMNLKESEQPEIKTMKVLKKPTIREENSSVFVSVKNSGNHSVSEISDFQELTDRITKTGIISNSAKLNNEQKEKLSEQEFKNSAKKLFDSENRNIIKTSDVVDSDNSLSTISSNKELNILKVPSKDTFKVIFQEIYF
jgi:hypothetical protein